MIKNILVRSFSSTTCWGTCNYRCQYIEDEKIDAQKFLINIFGLDLQAKSEGIFLID